MRIVVATGPRTGLALTVERRLVVGRDEGCDLVLADDEKVSRRHCAFSPNPDGTLSVEDAGSANGTFVGGERISAPVTLRGGEEVRVGGTVLRAEREQAEQETLVGPAATMVATPATTVGAPATMVAGAPPPAPPEPPPDPERPWWRSRWALIGGAVVLLAIGGIVGGILGTRGGGDDEPVAVATTDEQTTDEATTGEETVTETQAETETETVETVETETLPETGATETGVVDGDGLTALELGLLTYVPEALQATCQGYEPAADELLAGRVTGLYCPTSDGISLYYDSYDSTEAMDAAYGYAVGDIPRGEGDCSAAFPAEGTYTVGDDPAGRVVCFEGGEPVAPIIWWTTDEIIVLASAAWEGHTPQELFEWWATEPGPVTS